MRNAADSIRTHLFASKMNFNVYFFGRKATGFTGRDEGRLDVRYRQAANAMAVITDPQHSFFTRGEVINASPTAEDSLAQ